MRKLTEFYIKIIAIFFIIGGLTYDLPRVVNYFYMRGFENFDVLFYSNFISSVISVVIGLSIWFLANKISIYIIKENSDLNQPNIIYIKRISLLIVGSTLLFFTIPDLIQSTLEFRIISGFGIEKGVKLLAHSLRFIIGLSFIIKSIKE